MPGSISSLGIGSGVLSSDVIEQLRESDEGLIINPIDRNIEANQQKTAAIDLLDSLLTTFQASTDALSFFTLYQGRTSTSTNEAVTVEALAGSDIQDFSIDVRKLAQKDIIQSDTYGSRTDKIASGDGTLTLNIDGSDFDIDYTDDTTLEELAQAINDKAGSKVDAKILKIGDNDFRMIITSDETGKDQNIIMSDSGALKNSPHVADNDPFFQSNQFSATTDIMANAPGTMTFNVDGANLDVAYTATTTLAEMAFNINDQHGDKLDAQIVQNDTGDFRLVVSAKDSVSDASGVTVSDTGGLNDDPSVAPTSPLTLPSANQWSSIQKSVDAEFKYDGITFTRGSNEIDDLVNGVTITLNKADATNGEFSNVTINQDIDEITAEMNNFTSSYNALISQLDDMVNSDLDEGKVGIFNGDNTIKDISRSINKIVTSINGEGESLINFGISLSQDGTMSFDADKFKEENSKDLAKAELFFAGGTVIGKDGSDSLKTGLFEALDDRVNTFISSSGTVTAYDQDLTDRLKGLQTERERSVALLDARYETMTQRFIQYDSLISRLNNSFSALDQQIKFQLNGN
jgi:flagellar hook-associated protein 2